MKERNTMKTAFTLIEILIVVILLGVLAAIVVPQFAESTADADVSACKANQKAIITSCSMYKLKENATPADIAAVVTAGHLPEAPACPAGGTYTVITGACSDTGH